MGCTGLYRAYLHVDLLPLCTDAILLCLQIQLDFAAMQRDNPKLLTLKDFVMSANQAPESTSDVLSLLQAFSEFKQGDHSQTALAARMWSSACWVSHHLWCFAFS